MLLEYVSRSQLFERLSNGWSPAPGVDYLPGEYAFLLAQDDGTERHPELTAALVELIAIPLPKPTGKPQRKAWRRISPARRAAVIDRIKQGQSHCLISRIMGISRATISKFRMEAGI